MTTDTLTRAKMPIYAFTQDHAIRTLSHYYAIRVLTAPDDHIDKLLAENGPHRWFCYCLDAAARGFPVGGSCP